MAEFALGLAELGTAVDLSGLNTGIDQAEAAAKGGFERIGDVLNGALKIGLTAAIGGFLALGSAIGAGMADAREANQLLAATEQTIRSTGGVAGVTAQQVTDLATALSAASGKSLFGDAEVQASENMLLTFTNIGSSVFPRATQATVDLAQAFKTTPEAMSIMIGKALNSADAMSALKRQGVAFSDQQIELGKHLFETGHVVEYQTMVLDELGKEFGGQAAAAAKADGGWAQFTDRMGEAAELAGSALLPVLNDLFGFLNSSVAPVIESAAQTFASLVDAFRVGAEESGGFIGGLTNALYSLDQVSPIFDTIADVVLALSDIFSEVASQASGWGEGIINQLAVGMSNAFSSVIGVLRQLGSVIASWLQPHSPPKILPNIDDWGRETAELWVGGFGKADLSAISEMGDSVRSILSSIADSTGGSKTGIIPSVIGTEQAMADAIASVDQFGNVSENAIQKVVDASGAAGPQIAGLVRGYFDLQRAAGDVERAQTELNRVTEEYANQLTPLNAELKQIQDQKRAIQDQKRLRDLQTEINDGKTDQLTRQSDILEMQEIQKRAEVDAVTDQRDAAVDAAKQQLDTAQVAQKQAEDALITQKAQISAFSDQKKLMTEQRDLLKQLAKTQSDAAKRTQDEQKRAVDEATRAHAEEIQNAVEDAKSQEDKLAILRQAQSQTEQGSDAWRAYQKQIDAITKQQEDAAKRRDDAEWNYRYSIADEATKLQMLQEKLGGLTSDQEEYWSVLTRIDQVQDSIDKKNEKKGKGTGGGVAAPAMPAIQAPDLTQVTQPFAGLNAALDDTQQRVDATRTAIVSAFTAISDAILQNAPTFQILKGVVEAALPPIQSIVTSVFEIMTGFIQEHGQTILFDVTTVWQQIQSLIDQILPPIQSIVQSVFGALATFLHTHGDDIKAFLAQTWDSIAQIIKTVLSILQTVIPPVLSAIAGFIHDHGDEIQRLLSTTWDAIKAIIDGALTIIKGVLATALALLKGDWQGAWDTIKGTISQVWDDIKVIVTAGVDNFKTLFGGVIAWLVDAWKKLPDQLAGTGQAIVQAVWDGIKAKWHELVEWFNDKLQELRDKLPFSEPKDKSSPLYGLADSGSAMVEMIQSGIDSFGDGLPSVFATRLPSVGAALPALSSMPGVAASNISTMTYNIGPIDARGSNWTEEQFKQMVRGVLNETGNDAFSRARARG